jgi:hypothetical protein
MRNNSRWASAFSARSVVSVCVLGCSGETDTLTLPSEGSGGTLPDGAAVAGSGGAAGNEAGETSMAAGAAGTGAMAGGGTANAGGSASTAEPGAAYVSSSLVFSPEGTVGYVSVLDSLAPQVVDLADAYEFAGAADVWVHEGSVFVSSDESFTITRFDLVDGSLVERGTLSLATYGLPTFGFWVNTFVAPDKAYVSNGAFEYIVWNPSTLEITGEIALPEPAAPAGFQLYPGYADRAAAVRGGRLYQPFYWTDESFFEFASESRIVVTDVATDTVVDEIVAPCPGLDYVTANEQGDLFFSAWVYAPGGAAVLDQAPTCVFEVPAVGEPRVAFDVASVAGGRQGGVLRSLGNGTALLSVLHEERFAPSATPSVSELTFAANWRFWSYDFATGTARPIDGIDFNAGAQYSFGIDQKTYTLVALADYSATTIFSINAGPVMTPAIEMTGWATRLFRVR